MFKLFRILIFLFPFISIAQTEVYVDENMNEIDSLNFYKKCNAKVLNCLKYSTDSLVINKIHNLFKFGKTSNEEYNQIRLMLMKKGDTEIAPDQILVIKHYDSIGGSYKSYLKNKQWFNNQKKNSENFPNNIKKKPLNSSKKITKSLTEKQYAKILKNSAKCTKRFERKFNVRVLMTFKYNAHKKDLYKNINWVKYSGTIIRKFLNQIKNGRYIILKPDGEYFVSSINIRDTHLDELFKNKDWTNHKNDLALSKTQNLKFGYGIFRPFLAIEENLLLCF